MRRLIPLIVFALAGCNRVENNPNGPQPQPVDKTLPQTIQTVWGNNDIQDISIFRDNETGCEYLASWRGGITPRLGADGNPACNGIGAPQ